MAFCWWHNGNINKSLDSLSIGIYFINKNHYVDIKANLPPSPIESQQLFIDEGHVVLSALYKTAKHTKCSTKLFDAVTHS